MRHITDDERRARLAVRHGLAVGTRLPDAVSATRAMTVLHATEPATVHLSLAARVDGLATADVDAELYDERSLVKQLAMRRTLFVFPRDLLPAAWGSASARVAATERRRLAKDVVASGIAPDGAEWVEAACAAVEARLAGGEELSTQELREQLPELDGRVVVTPEKSYGGAFPVAPRVLTVLGAEARVVRGRNATHWRGSRPRYAAMERWLGERPEPWGSREGYAELVRRWLRTFGPGTSADLRWWLGATGAAVSAALADVEAVEVSLDGATTGWVLPDDLDPVAYGEPWAALLPVLDPTTMGWQERGFLLGPHGSVLFDRNGNAGTTAWWNGRIVGCWVQDADGVVEVVPAEPLDPAAERALATEAERLTSWIGGVRVGTVYPSPLMRQARGS
ncbi:winged helix DNA-binding domain-containing protein [Nocardioides pacificus]